MQAVDTNWTTLKGFVDAKGSSIQYLDDGSNYFLYVLDGNFTVQTVIPKSTPASSDQTDFENNYKANGNQKIKVLSSITDTIGTTEAISQYDTFIPLNFGTTATSPAYPGLKSLVSYIVPAGKTLEIQGCIAKTAALTTYLGLYTRKILWDYCAVAVATPGVPTLTARTITGSGLTAGTYRYKIVAVNNRGSTIGGTEASITLTSGQNAINLAWTAVPGALHYQIYRTIVNGASGTEVYAFSSEAITKVDILADSELGIATPPVSNTTASSAQGGSFSANNGSSLVVVDTLSAITTATAIDVIYTNTAGIKRYLTVTPGTAAGSQIFISTSGQSNPTTDNRIANRTTDKDFLDFGIKQINSVGNLPATGSLQFIAYNPIAMVTSSVAGVWNTTIFPSTISIPAGSEVVIGISSFSAVTTAARNDFILIGKLV